MVDSIMSKVHQAILLESHIEDLRNTLPGVEDVFVCPICLKIFSPDCIENDLVDVGHVWPKFFRDRSQNAKHQHVLLCKKCNSSAGKSGDEIMQVDAQLDESKRQGNLDLRNLQVIRKSGQEQPLHLEAFVQELGDKRFRLVFPIYKKQSQRNYFGEQLNIFKQRAKEGPLNIIVYPPRGNPCKPFGDPTNTPLVKAGYFTSSYLLAFHQYGYRYILQKCLDPARDYIKDSFYGRVDDWLDFHESKDTCVQKCSNPTHFCYDPEIGFVILICEEIPFHYEVRFLDIHTRLPVPKVFEGIERQHLIHQFLETDELSSKDGQILQSISIRNMIVSNLDHPILLELKKS